MDEKIRLNKYLAFLGIGSRRDVNEFIKQKRVRVNNKIGELNDRINPQKDEIFFDGKKVNRIFEPEYILLNKPKGIVSTTQDEFGRITVVDLIKSQSRLYPVGRLDANTKGALILTNDGDLTFKLTHPKFHVAKTYHLTLQGEISDEILESFKTGIRLKEGIAKVDEAKLLQFKHNRSLVEIIIHQGWNHQIKRMCSYLKLNLISLKRVAIGNLELGDLEEGKYRKLSKEEIENL